MKLRRQLSLLGLVIVLPPCLGVQTVKFWYLLVIVMPPRLGVETVKFCSLVM